jgi:hypothetical protein
MAQRLAALAALAALLLAPPLAQGLTITESHDQDNVINVDECKNTQQDFLSLTWALTLTGGTAGNFTVTASTQANCPEPSSTNNAPTPVGLGTTTSQSLSVAPTVSTILSNLGVTCPGSQTILYVCVTNGTTTETGSIALDLATPPAPVAEAPTPGDGALTVKWSLGQGSADGGTGAATRFKIYCDVHPQTSPIAKKCGDVTGQGTTETRVSGLTNGTEYDVEVTALTQGGNESPRSTIVSGTPTQIDDFWRLYQADGGREQGGCAAGAGGLVAILALVPLAWRRRRRRP